MKEDCTNAAINFLTSNLLKRTLTKHKKGAETSVNPEEDQSIEDHDKSLNFGCLYNYMYSTTKNDGFL